MSKDFLISILILIVAIILTIGAYWLYCHHPIITVINSAESSPNSYISGESNGAVWLLLLN